MQLYISPCFDISQLSKAAPVCTCDMSTAGGDTDHRLISQAGPHMQVLPSEDALLQSPHAALQQHQHLRARSAVPPGGESQAADGDRRPTANEKRRLTAKFPRRLQDGSPRGRTAEAKALEIMKTDRERDKKKE